MQTFIEEYDTSQEIERNTVHQQLLIDEIKIFPWTIENSSIHTKIAATLGWAAVREARRNVVEPRFPGNDIVSDGLKLGDGAVPFGGGDAASLGIPPWGLPPRSFVLYEYVRRPHLLAWWHFRRNMRWWRSNLEREREWKWSGKM